MKKITVKTLSELKVKGEKIAALTAYDYSFSSLLDKAGVDLIMVGDSLGMVIQGNDSTLPVTLGDMIYHSLCVAAGCERALLVVDMPFMSYQIAPEEALENAGDLMKEGGAHMVKLEGGAHIVETVHFMVERGIPVCGHLGLTPQSVHQMGGYGVQGKDKTTADKIKNDALSLQQAGAGALVLEAVPATLAKEISAELNIPTIGIGAGLDCDGQVLVLQDMLGIYPKPSPRFSKNFMEKADSVADAVSRYVDEVKKGKFPGKEHSF